jgi:hypothetical protein
MQGALDVDHVGGEIHPHGAAERAIEPAEARHLAARAVEQAGLKHRRRRRARRLEGAQARLAAVEPAAQVRHLAAREARREPPRREPIDLEEHRARAIGPERLRLAPAARQAPERPQHLGRTVEPHIEEVCSRCATA